MFNAFLTQDVKITKVKDHSTAGTSDITGSSVDMAADGGWDGVLFLTSFGTAAANNTMHAEQSEDNSSFADLEGSEVDVGSSDEDVCIDIAEPKERYVRPIATPGTSSTVESIWAIQYRGRKVPHSSTPNTVSGTINTKRIGPRPAEGTK